MRHKRLVLTVKMVKSVNICGSYHKIKTGVSLFWTTQHMCQKLWTLVGSRQRYCKNDKAYFWPTLYTRTDRRLSVA